MDCSADRPHPYYRENEVAKTTGELEDVFKYELYRYLPSLFDTSVLLQEAKNQ